jgi:hypothetical protein
VSLVSLADVKAHLNLTGTSYDTELQAFTDAAEMIVESHIGRPLAVRTVTDEPHSVYGRYELPLRQVPCACTSCMATRTLTVTGVTYNGAALDAGQWLLRADTGLLYRLTGITPWYTLYPNGILVTYTTGYTTAPAWLRMAILRLIEAMWQRSQLAPHPAFGGNGGGGFDDGAPTTQHVLTYATQAIIDPHSSGGF